MTNYAFTFCGTNMIARADGALWWPDKRLLCVSDLHLGKSERIARRGGTLLPPYETRETLWRLAESISATDPTTVICLGDSFDDLGAASTIEDDARTTLAQLQAGRDWIWIEGNHDPGPVDLGGTHMGELTRAPVLFRHIAQTSTRGEVSGHYHPKAAIAGVGRRPCFLVNKDRIILPAFGAYTGGLSVHDAALMGLVGATSIAVLTGKRAIAVPVHACLRR